MNNKDIIVIILGGGTNALGQIRCAHMAGYQCINVVEDCIHKYSAKSKYCKGYIAPHPYKQTNICISFIIKLIKTLPSKPYLFCASDDWMNMIGENETIFKQFAYIVQSEWQVTSQLYNKKYLYRLAEKYNVPYPKTIEIDSLSQISCQLVEFSFPCIVKPQITVSQNELHNVKSYHRTHTFSSISEINEWVASLISLGIDFPVLLQEYIPGDATNLYTLTSYSNTDGQLIAGSIGYKLRQFPPVAGRITSGVLHYNKELHKTGELFLKTIKYQGVANTEFKYDSRDGLFKLMEINTRFGAWNYSVLYSGINLMEIAINDYNGVHYEGHMFDTSVDGHIWYNFIQDVGAAIVLNRKVGFTSHAISIRKWKISLGKYHFEAVFDKQDILPFFYSIWYLINGKIKGRVRI